ncbi:hypothetical protein Tco_0295769 [Tanacetum coccineum]
MDLRWNPTTPRELHHSKAIVVTLVSSNTSKAQAHSRPHPHLPRTIGSQPIPSYRVVALKGELRMIQMGDQTADEYFSNIDSIVTLLNDLGSDVSQDDVVTYAINGLSDKYGSLAQIIAHKEPFPDLSTVRSMVSTEEMRIRNKSPSLSVSTNSSAPQVLLTETPHRVQDTRTNKERDNRNNNKTEVHASHTERIAKIPTYRLSPRSRMHTGIVVCDGGGWYGCGWEGGLDLAAQQQLLSLLQAQNTLLAQYGLSTISIPRTPIGFNNSGQRIVPAQPSAQQLMTHGLTPNQQALFTNAVQNTAHANWHMDTGASSHLNSSAHNLSTILILSNGDTSLFNTTGGSRYCLLCYYLDRYVLTASLQLTLLNICFPSSELLLLMVLLITFLGVSVTRNTSWDVFYWGDLNYNYATEVLERAGKLLVTVLCRGSTLLDLYTALHHLYAVQAGLTLNAMYPREPHLCCIKLNLTMRMSWMSHYTTLYPSAIVFSWQTIIYLVLPNTVYSFRSSSRQSNRVMPRQWPETLAGCRNLLRELLTLTSTATKCLL